VTDKGNSTDHMNFKNFNPLYAMNGSFNLKFQNLFMSKDNSVELIYILCFVLISWVAHSVWPTISTVQIPIRRKRRGRGVVYFLAKKKQEIILREGTFCFQRENT